VIESGHPARHEKKDNGEAAKTHCPAAGLSAAVAMSESAMMRVKVGDDPCIDKILRNGHR